MSNLIDRQAVVDILKRFKPEIIPYEKARSYVEETINTMYDRIEELPTVQPENQHGRIFQEIVVEYPSYYIYPEYKGKPYFSIKYTENGQEFIGYGTYKPEVLSEYLKEYFMPTAQPGLDSENLVRTIETGITATNLNDAYSLGMRNGMRWCKSLIDGAEPKYEDDVTRVDYMEID